MNIRIFTLACLFASALFPGMAGALDGTGSGTLEETILIKGCDNGLEYGDVTAFSIHTLGDWSLSTTEADYAGNYTLKKVKKKKKQGYAFNLALDAPSLDALIDELGESVNQLCGRAPDTLAITQASVTKFIAKLSTDRTTLTLKLALAAKASDGTVTYSPKYNLLAQLAFTPTGGGIGGKIAGQVLAPDGQIAAAEPPGLFDTVVDFLLPPSQAAVSGLKKVPNGTPVELVHLSQAGLVDGVLATTKVYKGKYKFNLDRLGHFDAPNLAVRVSDRGVEMRSFLTAHTVNISPLSEAVFQLALEAMLATPGALLEHFTFAELDDLYASVDLLTSLEGLTAVPGVDATVAAIKDLVAQDPGIVTFLTSTAEAGQTDIGPGDVGNLFPINQGNAWEYQSRSSEHKQSWTELIKVTGTVDINGITAMVLNYTSTLHGTYPFDEYLVKNSRGLYLFGNTDPEDYLTPEIVPYQEVAFPLKPGATLEIINLTDMEWAEDLDGDGMNEQLDVLANITTVGIEGVSVPAGNYPLAVKQEISIAIDITLSRLGKHVKATDIITQWLAEDVGVVKQHAKITVRALGETETSWYTDELSAYWVDDQGSGISSPVTLDPSALTDTSVTLNGSFTNPAGDTTTVWFEYGLTDAYGNSTPSAMYAADATIDHAADLSSLTNKTIYHYRIVTQNSMGVFYGEDKTFRTYISAVTLANNLNAPTSLHLHNNELYWIEVYDGDVMKMPTSGGTAVIEASSAIGGNSATLVMDMTDLYWADWDNIWTKPIGTGAVAPVATSLDFYGLVEVYATDLYAMSGVGNTSNSIDKIAISDGSVSQIITLPWYSRASIEVDATGVYWTNIPDAVIGKSQHDGSSEVTLAVGLNSPHSLILDSGALYWAESNAIKSMSTSGGAITTIAENVSPAHMTKDSTNFYFAEEVGYPAYYEYYIKSVNISSGVVEVLSKIDLSSNNYIRDIVVDDTYLYLLISGNQYYPPFGKILKYEKSY
jgi:hypothetical protein